MTLGGVHLMHEAMLDLANKKAKVIRIEEIEHNCDSITHKTIELLRTTFITPLDRDEILPLISRMDDVMDYLDAAAHRLILFEIDLVPPEMIKISEVLIKTQEQVAAMVKLFQKKHKPEEFNAYCMEINRLENEGDHLHRDGIALLFHNYKNDPLMVIKLKEIYEMLEMAIDCCEDVAELVEGIILEHS